MSKKQRINEKIKQVEDYLDYLYEIFPEELEEYKNNLTIKAACERYLEKIIEGCIEISFLIAKELDFDMPEDEDSIFQVLAKNGIISEKLSERLKSAKGMRNVLAHQYGDIDDSKIFSSIEQELKGDIEEFFIKIEESLRNLSNYGD